MIEPSRPQLFFAEGLIQEEVRPLWEEWMRQVDALLADREFVQVIYETLGTSLAQQPHTGTSAHPGRSGGAVAQAQVRVFAIARAPWVIRSGRSPARAAAEFRRAKIG